MRNLILSTLSTFALLIYPLSLSAQNTFSVSADVNGTAGDQAVTSLNASADQVVAIQIFGNNIQNANGLAVRFEYDASQVTYEGFDTGDVLPNAQALPEHGTNPTFIQIGIVSFGGQAAANSGLFGTIRFRTTAAFSGTEIRLVRAELGRGGRFETIMPNIRIALQGASTPANFSLSLDGDSSAGDQAATSVDVSTDEVVAIQIFGTDILNANGVSVRFEYDASQVTYEGFDVGDVLPSAQALTEQGTNPTFVEISLVSFGGQATTNSGLLGTIRFLTTAAFSGTAIRLVRAELGRGGQIENATIDARVELKLQVLTPDFNRDGVVNFADFLAFAGQFGLRQGDGRYEAKYDLDSDGVIGFGDFLIFGSSFGKDVSTPGSGGGDSTTTVTIPDANLRAVIADSLGKARGAPITRAEMATLTKLVARNKGIRSLTGLEHATNLQWLNLGGERYSWGSSGITLRFDNNAISDVSPLSSLTNLTSLNLSGNDISDFSPLSNLTNLTSLTLINTTISNLSPLSSLTSLTYLSLGGDDLSNSDLSPLTSLTSLTSLELFVTKISDVSKLSSLINLTRLNLSYNSITDISVLSGLTNLTSLDLWVNSITDISALSNLTNLTSLSLGNNITDISALSNLTNLTSLHLWDNSISDISALSNLTNLIYLSLNQNIITDISALSNLTNLTSLELYDNSISDISALSNLTNLEWLWLSENSISDISALSNLTNLTVLRLSRNSISDISPLVANTGLGSGDEVDVRNNPLSATSLNTHIPALQGRGVNVQFGSSKPGVEKKESRMPSRPVSKENERRMPVRR